MKSFIETITLRRHEMKMSQSQLAKAAGVSRNYISAIERGKIDNVSYGIFYRICCALKLQMILSAKKYEEFMDTDGAAKCFVFRESEQFDAAYWTPREPVIASVTVPFSNISADTCPAGGEHDFFSETIPGCYSVLRCRKCKERR